MGIVLENSRLLVKGEMTDVFQVVVKEVREDMMLVIDLIPNDYTKENGVEGEYLTVDLLNETIVDALKDCGYTVINEKDVTYIQN